MAIIRDKTWGWTVTVAFSERIDLLSPRELFNKVIRDTLQLYIMELPELEFVFKYTDSEGSGSQPAWEISLLGTDAVLIVSEEV